MQAVFFLCAALGVGRPFISGHLVRMEHRASALCGFGGFLICRHRHSASWYLCLCYLPGGDGRPALPHPVAAYSFARERHGSWGGYPDRRCGEHSNTSFTPAVIRVLHRFPYMSGNLFPSTAEYQWVWWIRRYVILPRPQPPRRRAQAFKVSVIVTLLALACCAL
jgi:hypothetical protein